VCITDLGGIFRVRQERDLALLGDVEPGCPSNFQRFIAILDRGIGRFSELEKFHIDSLELLLPDMPHYSSNAIPQVLADQAKKKAHLSLLYRSSKKHTQEYA